MERKDQKDASDPTTAFLYIMTPTYNLGLKLGFICANFSKTLQELSNHFLGFFSTSLLSQTDFFQHPFL